MLRKYAPIAVIGIVILAVVILLANFAFKSAPDDMGTVFTVIAGIDLSPEQVAEMAAGAYEGIPEVMVMPTGDRSGSFGSMPVEGGDDFPIIFLPTGEGFEGSPLSGVARQEGGVASAQATVLADLLSRQNAGLNPYISLEDTTRAQFMDATSAAMDRLEGTELLLALVRSYDHMALESSMETTNRAIEALGRANDNATNVTNHVLDTNVESLEIMAGMVEALGDDVVTGVAIVETPRVINGLVILCMPFIGMGLFFGYMSFRRGGSKVTVREV